MSSKSTAFTQLAAPDSLIRGTVTGGHLRAFAARTTNIVDEIRHRLNMYPTATAALGRSVTAGAMMGAMLKGNEKLTIQIQGNGPLGQLVVDANANGEVRGYVKHPQTDLPANAYGKLDVAGAVGRQGLIRVAKDLGMRQPYTGSSRIVSGELGEDFAYYFTASEQTPSAVGLGVLMTPVPEGGRVKAAGGFIIQMLPGAQESEIAELEQRIEQMPSVTTLIEQGYSPEQLLRELLPDLNIMDELPLRFQCSCSIGRVQQTLLSLGSEELIQIYEKEGRAELTCHFCNETYVINSSQLEKLIAELQAYS